ncbi:hypothetical protein [Pontibacillus salipaludis]|uniref:hypothetical protein n=1 Tax=Pontibacillus salipaludis TaxID=1697394 RepID=UPI0031EC1C07
MGYKENFEKALEMRTTESKKWYLEQKEKFEKELSQIRNDRRLTPVGKTEKIKKLSKLRREDLLRNAHEGKQTYLGILDETIKQAKEVAYKPAERPDEQTERVFKRELTRFTTEAMMAPRFESLMQKMDAFINEHVSGQYYADEFADQFPHIIQQALTITEDPSKAKKALARKYEAVTEEHIPEEVREARHIVKAAEEAKTAPLFNSAVTNNANEVFGRDVSELLNRTEEYFTEQEETDGEETDE